jgi:hypothetical protein
VVSDNSMCPGSTQPLKKRPVRKADNQPPSSADVTESGNLNIPEPSGPHRPVMGLLYLYVLLLMILVRDQIREMLGGERERERGGQNYIRKIK